VTKLFVVWFCFNTFYAHFHTLLIVQKLNAKHEKYEVKIRVLQLQHEIVFIVYCPHNLYIDMLLFLSYFLLSFFGERSYIFFACVYNICIIHFRYVKFVF